MRARVILIPITITVMLTLGVAGVRQRGLEDSALKAQALYNRYATHCRVWTCEKTDGVGAEGVNCMIECIERYYAAEQAVLDNLEGLQ